MSTPPHSEHAALRSPRPLVPSYSIVGDETERARHIATLQRLWGLPRTVRHFPGSNPISLERKHIGRVVGERCMVALKSDGVRYLLLLTTSPSREGEGIALMINRAMVMYEVEVWADFDFFSKGTILDGELVWEYANYKPLLRFVVFDVVCAMGRRHVDDPYDARMGVVASVCAEDDSLLFGTSDAAMEDYILAEKKVVAVHNAFGMTIRAKRVLSVENIKTIWEERRKAPHKTDGLVFTICSAPVEINTSSSTFKLKSDHTVDVLVQRAAPKWQAPGAEGASFLPFVLLEGKPVLLESVDVDGRVVRVGMRVNEVVSPLENEDRRIVECSCSLHDEELVLFPLKARFDKDSPNSARTVQRTVWNILEGLTPEAIWTKLREERGRH